MGNFVFARPDWHEHAACRGMMLSEDDPDFFIKRGDQLQMLKRVRKVCEECTVVEECLDYALRMNISVGVWGGASANERRVIRKERGMSGTEDTYFEDLMNEARRATIDRLTLQSRLD